MIDMIYAIIASAHCLNVEAVDKKLASDTHGIHESQMLQYAQRAIQRVFDYFKSQMEWYPEGYLVSIAPCLFCLTQCSPDRATDLDSLPFSMMITLKDCKMNYLCIYLSALTLMLNYAPLSGGEGIVGIYQPGQHVLCLFSHPRLHPSTFS